MDVHYYPYQPKVFGVKLVLEILEELSPLKYAIILSFGKCKNS